MRQLYWIALYVQETPKVPLGVLWKMQYAGEYCQHNFLAYFLMGLLSWYQLNKKASLRIA